MLSKLVSSFMGQLKPDRVAERSTTTVVLPPPELDGGEPLMRSLSRRRSERAFQKLCQRRGSTTSNLVPCPGCDST
jgi:hypothetical protein